MNNSISEILSLLNNVSEKKIVIVGDILLDEYVYGEVSKVSTGIQIPIVEKKKVTHRLGGAANIAANVSGLCKHTFLIGRCSNDDAGDIVTYLCKMQGINLYNLESDKTTVKQRIYIDNQQVSRLDTNSFTKSISEGLITILSKIEADVMIIADYLYGAISQEVIDITSEYCNKNAIPLFFTSRELDRFCLGRYPIVVVNQKEWQEWNSASKCSEAFVTYGKSGIVYYSENRRVEVKANEKYPVNVSGAGDSVLAVISLLYGEKIDINTQLLIANLAGELAVSNELTYVIDQSDLVGAIYEQYINDDSLNKVVDVSLARDIVSAWKQNGKKIVFTNGCYDLLHLGHIKSFQYSKKYGEKLVVAVNSDDSIKRLKGKERPINSLEERVSMLAYLSMIDMVISFDEDTAVSVISLIEPDVYIKGEEYKYKELPEAKYVRKIEYVPMIEGTSTTQLIKKIAKAVKVDGK